MHILSYAVLVQVFVTCYVSASDSEVAKAFIDNQLVPDIVTTAPTEFIEVNYPTVSINLGTKVTPLQTPTEPTIRYNASISKNYTFMFLGPDLPLDLIPPRSQVLHGLVINIPGEDIESGDVIAAYFPPVPYPGGLPYLFLLYEQEIYLDKEKMEKFSSILSRSHFAPNDFAKNMALIGPIAGNFMREAYLEVVSQAVQTVGKLISKVI